MVYVCQGRSGLDIRPGMMDGYIYLWRGRRWRKREQICSRQYQVRIDLLSRKKERILRRRSPTWTLGDVGHGRCVGDQKQAGLGESLRRTERDQQPPSFASNWHAFSLTWLGVFLGVVSTGPCWSGGVSWLELLCVFFLGT